MPVNLSAEDTALFYRLQRCLLAYANRQLGTVPGAGRAEDVGKLPRHELAVLRDALYADARLLDRYVGENPDGLATQDLAIIASWGQRVAGRFYVVRHLKGYSVFMSEKPTHLYGVLGLTDPIETVLGGAPLPVLVQATLLPFRGCIVYDGMMGVYQISFGRGIRRSMDETFRRLKGREGIFEGLVGPGGRPQSSSSRARKTPPKPAPDWRPAIDGIVAEAQKMRRTDTKLQGAALGLLRAAATLAQATMRQTEAALEAARRMRSVRSALSRLENALQQDDER